VTANSCGYKGKCENVNVCTSSKRIKLQHWREVFWHVILC